jgi:hypothetical protein
MNSDPSGSFNRRCPAMIAGPLCYARWSFFHAESSIFNISRRAQSLSRARLPAALLIWSPPDTKRRNIYQAERAQKANAIWRDQASAVAKNDPPGRTPSQREILRVTSHSPFRCTTGK